MLSFLSRIKYALSHVKTSTWHYRAVENIWGWGSHNGKACTYYWIKLPTSLLALLLISVLGVAITAISWFMGFVPTWFETKDPVLVESKWRNDLFYPYGYTSKGKKRRIMAWPFGLAALVIGSLYYLAVLNQTLGLIVVSVVIGVLLLGLIVYAIVQNWSQPGVVRARAAVKAAWDKACPPLVVVDNDTANN